VREWIKIELVQRLYATQKIMSNVYKQYTLPYDNPIAFQIQQIPGFFRRFSLKSLKIEL